MFSAGLQLRLGQRYAVRAFASEASKGKKSWSRKQKGAAFIGVAASGIAAFQYRQNRKKERVERHIHTAQELRVPKREENILEMQNGVEFDLLVVGGGATGSGLALDAATRGLRVAMVEAEDFGSGTSSRSTKLIWAGSRYLVQGLVKLFSPQFFKDPASSWHDFVGTFKMVLGCHRERQFLLELQPHLTNWLPIAVPLDEWFINPPPFGYWPASIGPMVGMFPLFFTFYDALGGFCSPSAHVMSPSRANEEFPQLASRPGKTMKYVSVFYEGQHDDSRTNLAIALTAAMKGACVANHVKVAGFTFDGAKASGARCVDQLSGKQFVIKAKKIILCGGPFTDDLRKLSEGENTEPAVLGAGGTHIVLPSYFCPRKMGLVDMQTSDGRFLFFLPWLGHTLVGTTDSKCTPKLHIRPPEDEIQWLLNECEKYLAPELMPRRADVLSAWHGVRPLARDPNAEKAGATKGASRDHIISHNEETGITFISGGKWTTYREMAEDVLDKVIELDPELAAKAGHCQTNETALIGLGPVPECVQGWHPNLHIALVQKHGIPVDVAEHLANTYGTRAFDVLDDRYTKHASKSSADGAWQKYNRLFEGYPYIEPEIRYAIDCEYARTAEDILSRRTRLSFLNVTGARLALPRIVEIMAAELGKSKQWMLQELRNGEKLLNADFCGPVADKAGASLRFATTADIKQAFDTADKEGRGLLDKDGLAQAAAKLGFHITDDKAQKAIEEIDPMGHSTTTFPAFLAWWNSDANDPVLQELSNASRLRRDFDEADKDKAGSLTQEQATNAAILVAARAGFILSDVDARRLIDKMNVGPDDRVRFSEFEKGVSAPSKGKGETRQVTLHKFARTRSVGTLSGDLLEQNDKASGVAFG